MRTTTPIGLSGPLPHRALAGVPAGRRAAPINHDEITALVSGRPPWMEHGACNYQLDVDWQPSTVADAKPAKLICAECPVRKQCLQHGLDNPKESGIYGGMTDAERKRVLSGKAPKRVATSKPSVVKRRRQEVAELHAAGFSKWCIATQLNIDIRTVQRYLRPDNPSPRPRATKPEVLLRMDQVRQLTERGLTSVKISDELGLTVRTVKRYRALIKAMT